MTDKLIIGCWKGEPINHDTPQDVLLEIIQYLAAELEQYRTPSAEFERQAELHLVFRSVVRVACHRNDGRGCEGCRVYRYRLTFG